MSTIQGSDLKAYCTSSRAKSAVSGVDIQHFARVTDLDPMEWSKVISRHNGFLCLDYLRSLEEAHDEGLELRYVLFRENKNTIGAAAFQITHFTTSEDAYQNPVLKAINSIAAFFRGKHIHNILICGNAIATGEHGFCIPGASPEKASALIALAMNEISEQEKRRGKRICAMVVKDFYPESAVIADELTHARFRKFQVDHNMVMPVLPEWKSFSDYLAALNTKFRTKAKSAMQRSSPLVVKDMTPEAISDQLSVMERLYENVHSKADFRLGRLNLETLKLLRAHLPEQFSVKGYYLDNHLVGFMTAMRCGKTLEAHVIGIDYSVNRDYAVYQRMLYDYVDLAILSSCEKIVFGRTAAEIKSSVGAFPVDLTCCILHQRRISNALLSLILNYVKPSEFPQREPYKSETVEKIKMSKRTELTEA